MGTTAGGNHPPGGETLYVAVFGTLWGLLEVTLGTVLKGTRIPFTGYIMAALAVILFITGRRFVHRPGSVLMMAGVAALLKLFSIGGFLLGPVVAIVAEGLIGDAVLSALRPGWASCALAGTLVLVYTTLHPLVTQVVLYGAEILPIYLEMLGEGAGLLGLEQVSLLVVGTVWLGLLVALGATVGVAGHRLGAAVERRVERLRVERRTA